MIKFETFKAKEAKKITEFLTKAKIIENGIIVIGDRIGFLHKDNDDVFFPQDEAINGIASRLVAEQKNLVTQESLIRLSRGMLQTLNTLIERKEAKLKVLKERLESADQKVVDYKEALDNNKKKYDQEELNRMRKDQDYFKEEIAKIEKELDQIIKGTGSKNDDFNIAAQEAYLEQAVEAKRGAELSVAILQQYILDLQNKDTYESLTLVNSYEYESKDSQKSE